MLNLYTLVHSCRAGPYVQVVWASPEFLTLLFFGVGPEIMILFVWWDRMPDLKLFWLPEILNPTPFLLLKTSQFILAAQDRDVLSHFWLLRTLSPKPFWLLRTLSITPFWLRGILSPNSFCLHRTGSLNSILSRSGRGSQEAVHHPPDVPEVCRQL